MHNHHFDFGVNELMENKLSLKIPLGYTIIKKTKKVDIWEAETILTSRKRKRYIQAIRKDTSAELVGDFLICPICNSHYVANTHNKLFRSCYSENTPSNYKEKVQKWSDTQISFFEDNRISNLYISSSIKKPETFTCPKCKTKLEYSEDNRQVEIINRKKKVVVECEIKDINEIFLMKWLPKDLISISFPMYEIIVFDLSKGRVRIKLRTENGDVICARDITNHPELIAKGVVDFVISSNKLVNRTIKRFFSHIWNSTLPYDGSYINIIDFFKMTMFVGYDKEFYDHIPYKLKTYEIDTSFKNVAKKIQNRNNIIAIYENSMLPNVKSIRKVCFEKSGLFFYLNEIENLYEIIKDKNIFCDLLKSKSIFEVLSELHIRPLMLEFFIDYVKVKGAKSLLRWINRDCYEIKYNAIDYIGMSDNVKKTIQQGWKKKSPQPIQVSIPMMHPIESIRDCTVDEYKFFWLRNRNDYIIAGENLQNCLGGWRTNNWPVVCVKKREKYVAAIEVSNKGIEQAFGFDNRELKYDERLFSAFEKWRFLNKLEFVHGSDLTEADEEMII